MIAGKLYVAMPFTAHLVIVDASMRLRISEFPMQHSQRRNTVIEYCLPSSFATPLRLLQRR